MTPRSTPAGWIAALRARLQAAQAGEALDVAAAVALLDRLARATQLLEVVSENGVAQLENSVRERSVLARLGEVFDSAFDPQRTCEALLQLTMEALPCENVVLQLDRPAWGVEIQSVGGPTPTAEAFEITARIGRLCRRDAAVLTVSDVFEDERFRTSARRSRLRSVAAAPIRAMGETLGAVVLCERSPEAFPPERLRILGPITDLVAAAVTHSRLCVEDQAHRRGLEARVAERTREVTAVRAALSRQERNAALGRLAASIAHEVNNPMSYLVSNLRQAIQYSRDVEASLPVLLELLESVLRIPASEDGRVEHARAIASRAWYATLGDGLAAAAAEFGELLAETHEGALRIQRVGEDLRGFAQGIAGVREPVHLNPLVETALHVVASEAKDVHYESRLGVLPKVRCQRYEITQVLMTLIENASEASDTVRISTRAAGTQVEVEIVGEEPDSAAASAELDPERLTDGGLALTITQDVVDSHHGSLDVQAGPEGRVLTLRLPVAGSGASAR